MNHPVSKSLSMVRPAAQIAPKSSLGVILNKLARKYGTEDSSGEDSSPNPSESEPDNDPESENSDQSQESIGSRRKAT